MTLMEWLVAAVIAATVIALLIANAARKNEKYERGEREGKTMAEVDLDGGA